MKYIHHITNTYQMFSIIMIAHVYYGHTGTSAPLPPWNLVLSVSWKYVHRISQHLQAIGSNQRAQDRKAEPCNNITSQQA